MTVYQKCPYCERVFEIGPEDYEPMKRHIGFEHTDEAPPARDRSPADGRSDAIERANDEAIELTIDTGDEDIDFESADSAVAVVVELSIHVDLKVTRDGEIVYEGDRIVLKRDEGGEALGATSSEDGGFEYAGGGIYIDAAGEKLEYTGPVVFERKGDGGEDEFKATKE